MEILAMYWPAIASAVAAMFFKKDDKPIWKIIGNVIGIVKPTPTPDKPTIPPDFVKMLQDLIRGVKPTPAPTPTPTPDNPDGQIDWSKIIQDLIGGVNPTPPPAPTPDKIDEQIALLVSYAITVGAGDKDVLISITADGPDVKVRPRKVTSAEPK